MKGLTDLVADGATIVVSSAVVAAASGNGDEDTVGTLDLEEVVVSSAPLSLSMHFVYLHIF